MRLLLSSTDRRLAAMVTLFSALATASIASAAPDPTDDATSTTRRDREIALDLIEQQVHWLGMEGVRSALLTDSFDRGKPDSQLPYIEWLEHVSARLENNPYLISHDPQNEPVYEDDSPTA